MRSLILLNVLLAVPLIAAQHCTKTISTPYVGITYRYVSRSTTCHYKCVLKHTTQVNTDYNAVNTCSIAYKNTTATECCEGYRKNSTGDCDPICHGCQNGQCLSPGKCICNEGFRMQLGICVPTCEPECGFGTCEAPGQCSCDEGYVMDSRKGCIPSCDPPCQNGDCIGVNTCECFSGFRKTAESNICTPRCDPELADCGSGTCVGPNRCNCVEGFVFENNRCIPKCNSGCINGACTKPNVCTCKEGFMNSPANLSICIPSCNGGCQNGTCIAPNTCQCLPGYRQSNTLPNSCEPSCDSEFVDITNGRCIASNVLQCNEGFVLEYSSLSGRTFCRYPCEQECVNGVCQPDGTCRCRNGFSRVGDICEPIGMKCTEKL